MKIGRNDPCHCGSGKKYKHCHSEADRVAEAKRLDVAAAEAAEAARTCADDEESEAEEDHRDWGHGKYQGSRFIRESGRGKRSPGGPGGGGSGAGSARINRGSRRGG